MQPADPATNRSITEFGSYSFQLEDGEVIQFQGGLANNCGEFAPHDCANWSTAMRPVPGRDGIFKVEVGFLRSRDHGTTQTLNVSSVYAPRAIMYLLSGSGFGMSGIIQTEDGSLLAPSCKVTTPFVSDSSEASQKLLDRRLLGGRDRPAVWQDKNGGACLD